MHSGEIGRGDTVRIYNPVGFDPNDFLPPKLARYPEHARFFIHCICWNNIFSGRNYGGYTPLMKEIMVDYFPGGDKVYQPLKRALGDGGAVECDDIYSVGIRAKGYRLGSALRGMKYASFIVEDRKLKAKILAHREAEQQAQNEMHRYLRSHLDTVEIDADAAHAWINGVEHEPEEEIHIDLIRDKAFRSKFCPYGRFHSNLTNMRRGVRPFLSAQGSSLVNLDIRNSQPLVFAAILARRFPAGPGRPADVSLYIDLVQKGKFYEYMMEESRWPAVPPAKAKEKWADEAGRRGVFKEQMFANVFYCNPRTNTDLTKAFQTAFPNVHAVIRHMKSGKGPDDFKRLNYRMQKVESGLMIGRIARRCKDELPQAFVATIHDSILTTPDRAEPIMGIMRQEFKRVGLRPSISSEDLARLPARALGQA